MTVDEEFAALWDETGGSQGVAEGGLRETLAFKPPKKRFKKHPGDKAKVFAMAYTLLVSMKHVVKNDAAVDTLTRAVIDSMMSVYECGFRRGKGKKELGEVVPTKTNLDKARMKLHKEEKNAKELVGDS